ncbi:MAG: DUF5709 domain-containing protein [Actinomycetes bacterium]
MSEDIYDPGSDLEDDGVLQPADSLDEELDADVLDTGVVPADRYAGATRFGTTLDEERRGESLDQLLAEEEPDRSSDDDWVDEDSDRDGTPAPRAGRLVAPDEGAHGDDESDAVAFDVGIDGAAASAEEAAVHIIEE